MTCLSKGICRDALRNHYVAIATQCHHSWPPVTEGGPGQPPAVNPEGRNSRPHAFCHLGMNNQTIMCPRQADQAKSES